MARHWSLDDIDWDRFDQSKLNPDTVKIVRAAAMVESNARDYAEYLCNVFYDDLEFQRTARRWAEEEVQHGLALARWATLADASFDYDRRFADFREGFKIDTGACLSSRGSRAGELIARCMVEVGTSSYYTAIADSTDEPVLIEICRYIATDEWRHYGLFYRNLRRYLIIEPLPRWRRIWIAVGRITETEDDELAYAYYSANFPGQPYHRRRFSREYGRLAFGLYRPSHVERAMTMIFKAVGLSPHGLASRMLTRLVVFGIRLRTRAPRRQRQSELAVQ